MTDDLLSRLTAANSTEERTWIVTEDLLNALASELYSAAWATAIPHWFDADILAALRPELKERAGQLYVDLQALPFVEVFPGRGHNIHELTRRAMLDHLWRNNTDEFRALSARAAKYFSQDHSLVNQSEWLYHLLVAEPANAANKFWNLGARWNIGDVLRLLKRDDEALARYDEAMTPYRLVLGRANLLISDGDERASLQDLAGALKFFQQALTLYEQIGDRTNQSQSLLRVAQLQRKLEQAGSAANSLVRAAQIADEISMKSLQMKALEQLTELSKEQGNWKTLITLLDSLLVAHPNDFNLLRMREDAEVREQAEKPTADE